MKEESHGYTSAQASGGLSNCASQLRQRPFVTFGGDGRLMDARASL